MKARAACTLALVSFLSMVFSVSCAKQYHQDNERYVFVTANAALPYWQEAKAGFIDAARSMGTYGVKADFTGPDAYNPEQELEAFKQAVAGHPTGILVSPTRPELFNTPIQEAVKAGIPVITIDSDAPESHRVLYIGTDNVRAGMESGRHMGELLHGTGVVYAIATPGQLNQDQRIQGAKQALEGYSKIKIAAVLNDESSPEKANDLVSGLIGKKEKIDGILCLEASGGPGAAEVLHRLSLEGKITIVAFDKNPETLDAIAGGVTTGTIGQKPYTMAYYGLKFLDDLHHNVVHEFKDWRTAPASPLPTRVDTGTVWIDKSNVGEFKAALASHPQQP